MVGVAGERDEQPGSLGIAHPAAVVGDSDDRLPLTTAGRDRDGRVVAGVAAGVVHQVPQCLAQKSPVGQREQRGAGVLQPDRARVHPAGVPDGFADQSAQVELLQRQLEQLGVDPGLGEHVLGQRDHLLGVHRDGGDELPLPLGERAGGLLGQQFGSPADQRQRRSDLVGEDVRTLHAFADQRAHLPGLGVGGGQLPALPDQQDGERAAHGGQDQNNDPQRRKHPSIMAESGALTDSGERRRGRQAGCPSALETRHRPDSVRVGLPSAPLRSAPVAWPHGFGTHVLERDRRGLAAPGGQVDPGDVGRLSSALPGRVRAERRTAAVGEVTSAATCALGSIGGRPGGPAPDAQLAWRRRRKCGYRSAAQRGLRPRATKVRFSTPWEGSEPHSRRRKDDPASARTS